jgi:hypothetical protein
LSPYGITIVLFSVAGLSLTVWGWMIIARGKKTLRWPSVEGVITQSLLASEENDTLPKVTFHYQVGDQHFHCDVALPGNSSMTPEFAESYVKKYKEGDRVSVHYNPVQPSQATIEPGLARDDWLVFATGIAATLFGVGLLLFAR